MENRRPFFSVIIPVYNVEDYLGECLDSLIGQTFSDFEVIVVDDVSTDGSRDVARQYVQADPNKFRLIEHQVNTRQGGARNTGIEAATGRYLMFLDSDDFLKPETLQTLARVLEQENADIVECNFSYVDENGNFLRCSHSGEKIARLGQHKPLLISGMGPCNKAFRASLFQDTGIRFPEKYYYEDYWIVPKVLMAAKHVVYIEDALYCYRQRSTSTMHDTNIERNRDIMTGTDSLIQFLAQQDLPQDVADQLESLAIENVLLHGTLRVNTIDPRSPMQKEILAYMDSRFPNYRKNPYHYRFSAREKRLIRLIGRGRQTAVHLLWYRRNCLTGAIKSLLHKIKGN